MGVKSRGNYQVNWCKYVSCVFHGTTGCNDCVKCSRLLVPDCPKCGLFYLEFADGSQDTLVCPDCEYTCSLSSIEGAED